MYRSPVFRGFKRSMYLLTAFIACLLLILPAYCQADSDNGISGDSKIFDNLRSKLAAGDRYSPEDFTSLSLRGVVQLQNKSTNGTDCYLVFIGNLAGKDDIRASKSHITLGLTSLRLGLALPDEMFWANLNPTEPDRIVDKELANTDVGRIMLEADMQMKRDFSKYENPCQYQVGRDYWKLLEDRREDLADSLYQQYPTQLKNASNINFAAAIRNWIVPGKIYALEDDEGFFVVNYSLDINQEPAENYSSMSLTEIDPSCLPESCLNSLNRSAIEYGRYAAQLQEKMILPLVVEDINLEERYSDLRRVYAALAVAQWYKAHYSGEIEGLSNLSGSCKSPWNPESVWQDYVVSFNDGEVKCWQTINWNNTTITTYNLTSSDIYNITNYYYNQSIFNSTTWSRSLGSSSDLNESLETDKTIDSDVDMGEPKYESMQETSYSISSSSKIYTIGGVDYSWILKNQVEAGSFHDTVGMQFFNSLKKDARIDPSYAQSSPKGQLGILILARQQDRSAKFNPAQTASISFGPYILSSWYYSLLRQRYLVNLN
jgi:hypothetical protein